MHYRQLTTVLNTLTLEDRWDSLIRHYAEKWSGTWKSTESTQFVDVPWLLIKAQIKKESGFNPKAQSGVGAKGLLQLMPDTDFEFDQELDEFDPDGNLSDGVRYLVQQYLHFPEITSVDEKWKFALASYNGGRGYINQAIRLARQESLQWLLWEFTKEYLRDPRCIVKGRKPDYKQIVDYVTKIWDWYQEYKT